MNELEARIHRTWVELLVTRNYHELAATAVDCEIEILNDRWSNTGLAVNIPPSGYTYVTEDDSARDEMVNCAKVVALGRLFDDNGQALTAECINIVTRVKLLNVDSDWQQQIRSLIVNSKESNQGLITELVFGKRGEQTRTYNGLKFASQSEIRIAQELESRKVLFFPLAVGVRADTGNRYKDQREVDFLICQNGTWGVLEVSFHIDRYEQDSEKNSWLMTSGILFVKHYTSERCYKQSEKVVDEFLMILNQHKR